MRIIEKQMPHHIEPLPVKVIPEITGEDYANRIASLSGRLRAKGLTHAVVYGDREHFANMEYLTGYDPRFEEALLIVDQQGGASLVVGNEGIDYSGIVKFSIEKVLYSPFGLNGQPKYSNISLEKIFANAGIHAGSRVGVVGWKLFDAEEKSPFDLPYFIFSALAASAGGNIKNLSNETGLMVSNDDGMRHDLNAKELILCEVMGTTTSRKVSAAISALRAGMTEIDASQAFQIDGQPLSVFPCVSFGWENVSLGLASPTQRKLAQGDPVGIGLAYRRANLHRMGFFAEDVGQLQNGGRVDALSKLYFETVVTWYEALRIGVTGGEVYDLVSKCAGGLDKLGAKLNPGHQTHTDEWTNSLFYKGSRSTVKSGMAIQCDIIACADGIALHAEDGIMIADEKTRAEIRALAPDCWNRIVARRNFMGETLGVTLDEAVLPTSDMQGIFKPCLMSKTALAKG